MSRRSWSDATVSATRQTCANVNFLCRFMQNPPIAAWHAALSIASYLHSTSELGIRYGRERAKPLQEMHEGHYPTVWSDASFSRDVKPFLGGFVDYRGAPLSWFSGMRWRARSR